MLKRTSYAGGFGLAVLVGVIITRTMLLDYEMVEVEPAEELDIDHGQAVERLAGALRFETISHQDPADLDEEAFEGFITYLEEAYPRIHAHLQRERVGEYSLLYRWEGSNPGRKPAMLIGHYDVVPVEAETGEDWRYSPFAGEVAEGFIWGRGAVDDKSGVLSTLEAIEYLLAEDYEPGRPVLIGLHHDEEVSGYGGARALADTLRARDVELEYLLDEGLPVAEEVLSGIESPLALVGVAEKGYLSLDLSLRREGGHSSMPPRETTIHALGEALEELRQNPMPGRFADLVESTLAPISPELPFAYRAVLANRWLFRPLLEARLSKIPYTDAALRTTFAPTMFSAGVKENVLPATASAVVNARIHPSDSIRAVVEHVEETISNPEIDIRVMERAREPSVVSDTEAAPYQQLRRSIQETFPGMPVAPSLFVAITASRHYQGLTPNIYRFRAIRARPEDGPRVHGTGERLSVDNYREMIQFKARLLVNTTS